MQVWVLDVLIDNFQGYLFWVVVVVFVDYGCCGVVCYCDLQVEFIEMYYLVEGLMFECVFEGKEKIVWFVVGFEFLGEWMCMVFVFNWFEGMFYVEVVVMFGILVSVVEKYIMKVLCYFILLGLL